MKAVRIHHTGGPDVLVVEDVETPKPPPGTVLVKVGVSGVNYTDVMARQGIYMSRESGRDQPRTMGTEVAGVVTAVGEGVEPDLVGSRVVAFVEGGYAEYAVADRRLTFRLPESVELGDAVAFLVQGVTAWELLVDRARLREGETVLVHSAAGGVGSLAVQLAHHLGASRVIATASTASKLALASRLGATDTVNYTEPGWADRVLDLTDGRGVDVVIEAVGGDIGEESLRILADNGRLVVYGVASKRMSAFAGSQLMQRNQAVLGYWLTSRLSPGSATAEIVPRLLQLADAGELTAIVQHVFPLERAAEAHQALADRGTVGKVALLA